MRDYIYDARQRGGGGKCTHLAKKERVSHTLIDNFGLRRRTTVIRRALCSPGLGLSFRYLVGWYITHRKFLGASEVKNFIKKQQKCQNILTWI